MLYVPADNPHRVQKALASGSDAVIIDLEDALAVSKKVEARSTLPELLALDRTCLAYVRVNSMSTVFSFEDIEAAVRAGADGISLPMVERAEQIFAVDWMISQIETSLGREIGSTDLLPVLETGAGLANAQAALTGNPRIKRAGLGVGDLSLSLNLNPGPDDAEVWPYRTMLVLASNAAGLDGPLDTVYMDLKNFDGLRESCKASKRAGFQGRRIIHPSQVDIVNEEYSPSEAEIANAERILAGFTVSEEQGNASIRVGEDFVDYPIAYKAERVLATRDALAGNLVKGSES